MAVRFAMGFARDLGLHSVELEGDSATVVTSLNSNEALLTPLGLLLEDIQAVATLFSEVTFSHIQHKGNAVAHALARHDNNIKDLCVWMEEVPEFIRE
ncbi:hypothetical protein L1049_019066 [Liquidambar formosana]|uniref:RNase H type-1 domain-containing protein n=1 Tax=Liquidambar formosana TaxID=63359 RepID=A0AAP0WMM4_LIQFO